jgi:cytoskeletal protein RodZ
LLGDLDLDIPDELDEPEIVTAPRRSFVTIAAILGAFLVVALLGIGIYSLVILPQRQAAELESMAAETSTAVALAALITNPPTASQTASNTPTPTNTTLPTNTSTSANTATFTPSASNNTEVATEQESNTEVATVQESATQVGSNLLTQAAVAQTESAASADGTVAPTSPSSSTATPTPSALPDTGLGDGISAPSLILSAALLLMVILLSRRLRRSYN